MTKSNVALTDVRESYYRYLLIPAIAAVDQLIKLWILATNFSIDSPVIRIEPYFNTGIMGGFLSELDPWISRIFYSVLFAFLLLFTIVVLHLLSPKNTPRLKAGLLLYSAGLLGNVTDRVLTGRIVDYIILPIGPLNGFVFNFADIIIAIGVGIITIALATEFNQIWKKNNLRKNYFIDPSFQWSLTRYFIAIALANFFVLATYAFSFIKIYLQPDLSLSVEGSAMITSGFVLGIILLQLCFLVALAVFGIYYSHRIAGPIYIFQKRMRDALESRAVFLRNESKGSNLDSLTADSADQDTLNLRVMDYFKTLQELSTDLERQLKTSRKSDS